MDVLQLLDNELKTKSNWSLEEKARYLYIRSCQLFSYDERYTYMIFKNMYDLKGLKDEIVLKEIDLRNVTKTDFLVVCTRYSRYVLPVLLEEFLDITCNVSGKGHEYNTFDLGLSRYIADATNRCDLERVKMGLRTKDYYDLDIGRKLSDSRVEKIDRKIEYLKDEYFDDKLERIINGFENEYNSRKLNEVDYLLAKVDKIKNIFDEINTFRQYSDASYCVNYLLIHFYERFSYYFKNNNLLNITNDGVWNFINVLDITFKGEKFNFILEPINGKYEFYEIPISEGEYYKKELLKESDFCK